MTPTEEAPAKNIVTLQDDYINVVWDGGQNADKVHTTRLEVAEAAQQLSALHKPVLLRLVIEHHPLMPNMGVLQEVLKIFRTVDFDRMVVCGNLPKPMMTLVSSIIASFHIEFEIEFMADPDEALTWLKSYHKK